MSEDGSHKPARTCVFGSLGQCLGAGTVNEKSKSNHETKINDQNSKHKMSITDNITVVEDHSMGKMKAPLYVRSIAYLFELCILHPVLQVLLILGSPPTFCVSCSLSSSCILEGLSFSEFFSRDQN
jgi:hypothetical protein